MELVVDTNILVSFFRNNPVKFIILNSRQLNLELYSPEHCWKELANIKPSLLKYSKLSQGKLKLEAEMLKNIVKPIPDELSKEFEPHAKILSPHDKDLPIFALALKLRCAIWSNEPAFKEQPEIKVFSTGDMIEFFL